MSERSVPLLKMVEKEDKTSLAALKLLLEKQTEVFARLRDWLQASEELRAVIDEYVNLHVQIAEQGTGATYRLDRIRWTRAIGPSGEYEYADRKDNMGPDEYDDFKMLLADLKEHGGRLTREGYFLWLFSDGDRVGRKPRRK